jgi:hypothetical protein
MGEERFFAVFWAAPDDWVVTDPPSETFSESPAVLSIEGGGVRELFDDFRHDVIGFSGSPPHYLKMPNAMRNSLVDGSPSNFGDSDPIYYQLPALQGDLSSPLGDIPIWDFWNDALRLDVGTSLDPSCVYGVTVSVLTSISGVTLSVLPGPVVPPEFQPNDWRDFAWFPLPPEGFEVLAHTVVGTMQPDRVVGLRPNTIILHLDFPRSYGRDHFHNVNFFRSMFSRIVGSSLPNSNISQLTGGVFAPLLDMTPPLSGITGGILSDARGVLTDLQGRIFSAYWKSPTGHPVSLPGVIEDDDVEDYSVSSFEPYPDQMVFSKSLAAAAAEDLGLQPSVPLASFSTDPEDPAFGTLILSSATSAQPAELFFPGARTLPGIPAPDLLEFDYSLRFLFRDSEQNTLQKDLLLGASLYWIDDAEAVSRQAAGLPTDAYLWPSKLQGIGNWQLYGESDFIPDCGGGQSRPIQMKQFSPENPNLPDYATFVANLTAQGYTAAEIADAASIQEESYGGFNNVDLRTQDPNVCGIDEMVVGVTLYTENADPTWQTTMPMTGPGIFDGSGNQKVRYGFLVNGVWEFQSFTLADVSAAREAYVARYPNTSGIVSSRERWMGVPNAGFALDGTTICLAVTFLADVTAQIAELQLEVRTVGLPSVALRAAICAVDEDGQPAGVLQVSEEVPLSALSSSFGWVSFPLTAPIQVTEGSSIGVLLFVSNPTGATHLSADDRIEWAFSDQENNFSFTMEGASSALTTEANDGDATLTVADGSGFGGTNFFVELAEDFLEVASVSGDTLNLTATVVSPAAVGATVGVVTSTSGDGGARWLLSAGNAWVATPNPSFDPTYRLLTAPPNVGMVVSVPLSQWAGSDLTPPPTAVDAFFIAPAGQSYEMGDAGLVGAFPGLTPVAGFNVPGTYSFPGVNAYRTGILNRTDGFVAWSSRRLEPCQLAIYPLAEVSGDTIAYLPTAPTTMGPPITKLGMFVTAACRRADGVTETVTKFVPGGTLGTNFPILLDEGFYVGIGLLWVDPLEFKDADPYLGYGPAERFVVRTS